MEPVSFPGTILPSGRLQLDDEQAMRVWVKAQVPKIGAGECGTRYLVTIEEQWSGEARKFYFKILKALQVAHDNDRTQNDWHLTMLEHFNEGKPMRTMGYERFKEYLDDVIAMAARSGVVVPEANPMHAHRPKDL
jgi:hypothetical protein